MPNCLSAIGSDFVTAILSLEQFRLLTVQGHPGGFPVEGGMHDGRKAGKLT